MQMTPLIGSSVMVAIIVVAMMADGLKHGMLNTRKDWAGFSPFLLSLVGLGLSGYWISGLFKSESRDATAIALFLSGCLLVKLVLDMVTHVTQSKQMKRQGFLSKREFNKRVDSALANVHPK